MKHTKTKLVMVTIILTVLAIIAVIIIAGLVVIYTGTPNVAATAPHGAITVWILSTTLDRSVEAAARQVRVPPDYDQINTRPAYYDYDSMCMMCHGAPGVDRQWVGKGQYPKPPFLYRTVGELSPAEVFWIIRNGLKDTGMPALTFTFPDDHIWRIAALVKKLPEMTPEEYKALGQGSGGTPAGPGMTTGAAGEPAQDANEAGTKNEQSTRAPGP
jgi:mono/diheme cytochrome c family protein